MLLPKRRAVIPGVKGPSTCWSATKQVSYPRPSGADRFSSDGVCARGLITETGCDVRFEEFCLFEVIVCGNHEVL